MEGAFFYILTPIHKCRAGSREGLHVLTALSPAAAAPLAVRTPARALPGAPILVLFGECQELRGTESALRELPSIGSVGSGSGNLAAGTEHSPSCSIKAPAARGSHGAGGVLIVCEIIVN